ncbi:MAG: hypothetical protein RBS73_11445 [Prolixibacteraceae bacterium]|jgi:hypothetical protein|nr:hypothetical protein [Prolixibacteraceae bacterium]
MKRLVLLTVVGLLTCHMAYSQSDKVRKEPTLPQEKVTANKEFDENGNLISFDSTYVYSWSSDSTISGFPGDIDFSDFFNWKGSLFDNDSAFMNDPFRGFHFNHEEIDNFFKWFPEIFPDSLDQNMYSYRNDSIIRFFGDSTRTFQFRKDSLFPDFQWQLNDSSMMRFFSEPKLLFQNDSIWKKHQKLLEQHRLEMEELQKKFFQF